MSTWAIFSRSTRAYIIGVVTHTYTHTLELILNQNYCVLMKSERASRNLNHKNCKLATVIIDKEGKITVDSEIKLRR